VSIHRQLALLLVELEAAMKAVGQWSDKAPSAEAMASVEPFACDTLSFAQWLQFIFIPRLGQLIAEEGELPRQSDIAAMAEMVWAEHARSLAEVFRLLRQIDGLLVGQ
jgi:uncharacterized protein YqcC (DUF446 family)